MSNNRRIILASRSPRRASLLKQIGLQFEIVPPEVDERFDVKSSPEEHVMALSMKKAESVATNIDDGIVIGADTVVMLCNEILGKPVDAIDAKRMLERLSGRVHRVYTAFTIIDKPSGRAISDCEATDVEFRDLGKEEIDKYVASGAPLDKAGAYGIQDDYGAVFVKRICGCFYTVVGFPLAKFHSAFTKMMEYEFQKPRSSAK
jgi:septum formation protein